MLQDFIKAVMQSINLSSTFASFPTWLIRSNGLVESSVLSESLFFHEWVSSKMFKHIAEDYYQWEFASRAKRIEVSKVVRETRRDEAAFRTSQSLLGHYVKGFKGQRRYDIFNFIQGLNGISTKCISYLLLPRYACSATTAFNPIVFRLR